MRLPRDVGDARRDDMHRVWRISFAAVATAMVMACANSDRVPTNPTGPTSTATVTAVAVSSVNVTATTVQLNATAKLSDGTTQDVTSIASWQSSNPSIATISTTGMLTVVDSGAVDARATYQNVTGSLRLNVSKTDPTARFSLSGVTRESPPNARPLANVRVLVTSDAEGEVSVMSDANGAFRIPSLPNALVGVEATKDGYLLWKVMNLGMGSDKVIEVNLYPTPPKNASGDSATARCKDGSWSWSSTLSDVCTNNGGIAYGVCPGPLCSLATTQ
jgi:Carboxypeptidase regulatory-like domain/Bacterial Ig-like domain (group 2)